MKKIVFLLVICLGIQINSALRCYTCSLGEDDTDTTCVDHPEQATVTNCNKKYCTIARVEYKDPKGKVASISRSCADLNRNEIVEDESNRYYYSSCKTALCNGGDGRDQGGKTGSLGDKSTIYCPGIGNGAPVTIGSFLLLLVCVFAVFIQ